MIMPKFGITYRGTIYPWQCDHMGHMNVMWHTGKFDEATWQLLSTLGLGMGRLRAEGSNCAALEQHIEYKRELHAGDTITIRSAVIEIRDKVMRVKHEMRNDETREVAATAILLGIYLDAASRKGRSIPLDIRERAQTMINCWEAEGGNFDPVMEVAIGPGKI
jgi:acyl-CoA thioester hydrolase